MRRLLLEPGLAEELPSWISISRRMTLSRVLVLPFTSMRSMWTGGPRLMGMTMSTCSWTGSSSVSGSASTFAYPASR
jgi:hypothetical protein